MAFVTKILGKILGNKSERDIKEINPLVEVIKREFDRLESVTTDQLREETDSIRQKIKEAVKSEEDQIAELKRQAEEAEVQDSEKFYEQIDKLEEVINDKLEEVLQELLPAAFAVVKETAKRFKENDKVEVTARDYDKDLASSRDSIAIKGDKAIWNNKWIAGGTEITWDMVHYDVQLIGGIVLHQGKIAEMATGEGKTLVATLPVFLNALTGRGVHLVTVNDYLAKRDSEWMGPIFEFHGLSVDCIDKHEPNSDARRKAYLADITYGTNNEFGFDYLRDNMAINPEDLVQRKHNYTIVDEVDSVLIDDARTPLIISGPVPKGDMQLFDELKPKVETLVDAQKNIVNQILAEARKELNDKNTEKAGFLLLQAYKGLPKNKAIIKLLSEEGNKSLMHKTENYYMQDNSKHMHKVTDELFFIIEEKNNSIEMTDKGIDLITSKTDDSKFFVLPDIGSEVAELEKSELGENEKLTKKDKLLQDYAVKSERIHTINQLLKAYTLFEKDVEYVVIDNKVKIVDEQTGRIMEGRRYSDGLHQAIEAKERVKVEAATQTFATITLQNYFRMYHKLAGMTGTAETEAGEFWDIYKLDVVVIPTNKPIVRNDYDDLVYKTKREKYNAVIDGIIDLVNHGRPVLVGTTSVEISELLSRMLKIKGIRHNVLNAKLHQREADIVAEAGKSKTVTIATNMAGRGTDIKLSKEVKEAGGLAIVGTERHESRRVDRQLRGRAGRQGDPGSSQFFVSLEDDLMRLFGSARISGVMDRLGLKEGEVIQHSMISKSIERAQKKVEENNFGIRKRLLEYDDVMNAQREVIYKRRYHALFGDRLKVDIANMIFDTSEAITENNKVAQDYKNFEFELIRYFSMSAPVSEEEFEKMGVQKIAGIVYKEAYKHYQQKMEHSASRAFPVIKQVYEDESNNFERISVPFSDGQKTLQVVTNLEKAYETEGVQLVKDFEKNISLAIIDDSWKTHLRKMDELKQSVQLAVHEQKDPLLIYKFEAFELFKAMLDHVNRDVISFLFKGEIPEGNVSNIHEARQRKKEKVETQKEEIPNIDERAAQSRAAGNTQQPRPQVTETITRNQPKIGRNDKVTIKNVMSGENKTLKYKQAIPLIEKGDWVLVNQ